MVIHIQYTERDTLLFIEGENVPALTAPPVGVAAAGIAVSVFAVIFEARLTCPCEEGGRECVEETREGGKAFVARLHEEQ